MIANTMLFLYRKKPKALVYKAISFTLALQAKLSVLKWTFF